MDPVGNRSQAVETLAPVAPPPLQPAPAALPTGHAPAASTPPAGLPSGGVAGRPPSGNGRWTRLSGTLDAYATTPGLPALHIWMWGMGHDDYLRWGTDATVTAIRFAGVR